MNKHIKRLLIVIGSFVGLFALTEITLRIIDYSKNAVKVFSVNR